MMILLLQDIYSIFIVSVTFKFLLLSIHFYTLLGADFDLVGSKMGLLGTNIAFFYYQSILFFYASKFKEWDAKIWYKWLEARFFFFFFLCASLTFWRYQIYLQCAWPFFLRHHLQDHKTAWLFNPLVDQIMWCLPWMVVQTAYSWILLAAETSIWDFLPGKFIRACRFRCPAWAGKAILIIKIVACRPYF